MLFFSSFYWLTYKIFSSNFLYAVAFPISYIFIAYCWNLLWDMLYLWDSMTGNEFWISSEGVILTFMKSIVFSRKLNKVLMTPSKSSTSITSARSTAQHYVCYDLKSIWHFLYSGVTYSCCYISSPQSVQVFALPPSIIQRHWFYGVFFSSGLHTHANMQNSNFNIYVRSL